MESKTFLAMLKENIVLQSQDHYSVLGLSKLRYKASPKEIRKACKESVQPIATFCYRPTESACSSSR